MFSNFQNFIFFKNKIITALVFSSEWIFSLFNIFQLYIHDCSVVTPFALLFFGGNITFCEEEGMDTICVDTFIKFHSPKTIANLVKVCYFVSSKFSLLLIQTCLPFDCQNFHWMIFGFWLIQCYAWVVVLLRTIFRIHEKIFTSKNLKENGVTLENTYILERI